MKTTITEKIGKLLLAAEGATTKEEADAFMADRPNQLWDLEVREGENLRCKDYCSVSGVCPYNKLEAK